MNHDLTKLAAQVRTAHVQGIPFRLPLMSIREFGLLSRLLQDPPVATSPLLH